MRVGGSDVFRLAKPDTFKYIQHGLPDVLFAATCMTPVYRTDLLPHRKHGIKRSGGLLKDHRDVPTKDGASLFAGQLVYVSAINLDTVSPDIDAGRRKQAEYGHCRHCFTAA